MNQQLKHLTDPQIEQYVGVASAEGPAQNNDEIEAHFANCDYCRGRYLEAERTHLGILEHHVAKTPYPGCPDEESLQKYAAGLCSPKRAAEIRTHAVRCDFCAPRLRQYLRDFSEELPNEAKDLLERLPASSKEWRQEFVRTHVVPPGFLQRLGDFLQRLKALFRFFPDQGPVWRVAIAGGLSSAVLAIVVAPPLVTKFKLHRAEQNLVAAIKSGRPSAMRLAWAPHSIFDPKRSEDQKKSLLDHPPSLMAAAQAAIEKQNSVDPRWIRLSGRVALLWPEEKAVDSLVRAKDSGLDDPETEIDLAVAYYQRATGAGQKTSDIGDSIQILNQVLENPKITQVQKASALFDLAIAYQTVPLWDMAVTTWEKYLDTDPDAASQWRKEAETNLDKAKSHNRPPRQHGPKDPSSFLSDPEIQDRIEEYQDAALRGWLLDATVGRNPDATLAVSELAELLERQHGDSWMNDFLAARRPDDQLALQALSGAITNNQRGQYTAAKQKADEAVKLFRRFTNNPGVLRAEFEGAYANQRLLEERACLNQSRKLGRELLGTHYRWLQIQIALEQAVCLNFERRVEDAKEEIERAKRDAATSNFRILGLRVQALDASIEASNDCQQTWQQIQAGLEQYWQGPSSPQRLYEFYSPLKLCWEKKNLWYAAEALERRMITILETEIEPDNGNVLLQATAHSSLEQILKELDEDVQAEEQANIAIQLLKSVEEPVALRYRIPIQLELADLQLGRADAEAAFATAQDVEKSLNSTQSRFFLLDFHRVRGDIQAARKQWKEAEDDYEAGIEIAEERLASLEQEDRRQRWAKEAGDVYRGLTALFLEQKRDVEALKVLEFYQYRPYERAASVEQRASGPSWPEIRQKINELRTPDNSSTRLIYLSTKNRLYIVTIGSTGIKTTIQNRKRYDLQHRIDHYLQTCSTLAAPDVQSEYLFSQLLQPVLGELPLSQTLVVDLDAAMHGVPLEALKGPEGWYFGEKFPVIYSPGYLRERNDLRIPSQQAPRWGLLVTGPGLGNTEGSTFSKLFPGVRSVNGADITPGDLPAFLDHGEILVFVGHGESGSLKLNDQALLQAKDFPAESLTNLQLAVLAACSSGVSPDSLIETNNLVHAFQSGGTPSIIASLWDVDSEATTRFMESFYSHLRNGESPVDALYEAKKEIMKMPDYRRPYYWAGFVLNGRI